jgi:hypothetical protein
MSDVIKGRHLLTQSNDIKHLRSTETETAEQHQVFAGDRDVTRGFH